MATIPEGPDVRRAAGGRARQLASLCAVLALAAAPGAVAELHLAALVGADRLHARGITGRGVTIATVGAAPVRAAPSLGSDLHLTAAGGPRLLAWHEIAALQGGATRPAGAVGESELARLRAMLSSRRDPRGRFAGVAPGADLVRIGGFSPDGPPGAEEVAAAVEWAVANRDRYGIRVLHLPPAAGPGRALARAVLDAWLAGVVVVAAAGNGGPAPGTVGAPGALPPVITVGGTLGVGSVAPFSGAGPTAEGFVKPEILAPAGPPPSAGRGTARRVTGDTAVSSAAVDGIVALLLEERPWLTPSEVKLLLLAGARPLLGEGGDLVSPLRQGAGLVDAAASSGLDPHVGGRDASGGPAGPEGALRGFTWSEGALRGLTWSDGGVRGSVGSERGLRGFTWSE